MANRVTTEEVKAILDTELSDLSAFITAASLLVTEKLGESGLGVDHLKEIERWLAAHLATLRDRRPSHEKLDAAEVRYDGTTSLGLDFTPYGQQVKVLDTTGTLAALGKKGARLEALATG